jgi:hypothetical protein
VLILGAGYYEPRLLAPGRKIKIYHLIISGILFFSTYYASRMLYSLFTSFEFVPFYRQILLATAAVPIFGAHSSLNLLVYFLLMRLHFRRAEQ